MENLARQVCAGDRGGLLLVGVRVVLVRGNVGKVTKVAICVVAAVEVMTLEPGRRPLRRRHRLVSRVGCPAREPSNEFPHPRHLLKDGNVDLLRLGFFGEPFVVVHDQPDATVPLPAPVRVPTALRDPAQRVRPNPSEQSERQDRVRAQHDVEPPHPRGPSNESNSGMDVLEVLVQSREVLAPPDPVPAVGVDPALVLGVDEQRRLQVCARSRVRGLGVGFQVVGGRRVASNFFSIVGFQKRRFWLFVGFEGPRSNAPRRRRESRRQASSPGTRECTRCLQWWRHCSHVLCCASAMIWLSKSTSKSPSSVSLAPVEVTALVGGWTAPACLCRGADRAAGAATSVGGHSYSVQSASEVLTIARSGGGALNARIEASVRRDEAGGRRCLLAAACVSGRFSGVQIRALEPRTTRIHRQPRVTRVEAFGASEEVPFQLFWKFCLARLQGSCYLFVFWPSRAPSRRTRGRDARSDAARVGVRVDSGDRRDRRGGDVPLLRRRRDRGGTVHVIGRPGRRHRSPAPTAAR